MQDKTDIAATLQRDQIRDLTKILINQESINRTNSQCLQDIRAKEPVCCPPSVIQHPQNMELSVMINPTITPNMNIGSVQDFQQQGCRTTLVQETQTSGDDSAADIEIDTSTHTNGAEPVESCAAQQGTQPDEVAHILKFIDKQGRLG